MSEKVRDVVRDVANRLSSKATYSDAMYELYVRMKVNQARKHVALGKTVSHEQVKKRFL